MGTFTKLLLINLSIFNSNRENHISSIVLLTDGWTHKDNYRVASLLKRHVYKNAFSLGKLLPFFYFFSPTTKIFWDMLWVSRFLNKHNLYYLEIECSVTKSNNRHPVPSFNLVFEYQPSRYKRAKSNLLADEKSPQVVGSR